MGEVITYTNTKYQCFCQIKLESGERILISIAGAPTPSVKIMKLGFFGLIPVRTIWEYNAQMAGSHEGYVRKMVVMFQDPLAQEVKDPLDVLRDRLLPCRAISEVRDSLLDAERSISG